MITYYFIIAAALLYGNAIKEYRFIALAVFLEFLLHKLAYNHLFIEFRADNKWFIYYIYASIQLPIIFLLLKLKSHFVISGLILMNLAYNLLVPLSYFNAKFLFIYEAKTAVITTIMLMELIYLCLLSQYARNLVRRQWGINDNYIDRVFRVRGWFRRGSGGVV